MMILSPLHQQASSPPHSSTMCVMPPMVPDMPSPSYSTSPTTPSYGHCYAITQLFDINIPNHAFLWPLVSISTSPLKHRIYYTTHDARHAINQLFNISIPSLTWAHCSGTSASFTALQFSGNMQPSSSMQYGGYVPGTQPTPPSAQPAPPSAQTAPPSTQPAPSSTRPASPYHLGEEPSSLPQN